MGKNVGPGVHGELKGRSFKTRTENRGSQQTRIMKQKCTVAKQYLILISQMVLSLFSSFWKHKIQVSAAFSTLQKKYIKIQG